MIFRVGIENNNEDRSIAWALDHPGCFAYGQDSQEAQINFLTSAREYRAWIAGHDAASSGYRSAIEWRSRRRYQGANELCRR